MCQHRMALQPTLNWLLKFLSFCRFAKQIQILGPTKTTQSFDPSFLSLVLGPTKTTQFFELTLEFKTQNDHAIPTLSFQKLEMAWQSV